jgi:phospholipid/cholesterol/gamma-HCH transport system permease protein
MKKRTRYVYRPVLAVHHRVEESILSSVAYVGEVSILFWEVLRNLRRMGNVTAAMAFLGVNSLPIALITITFSGMVLALYTAGLMVDLGLGTFVGGLVGLTMARELAPVLAAVVVAARAGSAIAAEIGSMKVTEQIDALRSLATDPIQYLVVPRFIAAVVMLPIVTIFGVVAGTLGGYAVASTVGVTRVLFFNSISQWVDFGDVVHGLMKTIVFGAIIAIVSCHQGLNASGGASGVGAATTRSVVLCIVFIYAADFAIVRLLVPAR